MKKNKKAWLFVLLLFSLYSCVITDKISSVKVEIMKPGLFLFPDSINNVVILNTDACRNDTSIFRYFNDRGDIEIDSKLTYTDLTNQSVDALANYLKTENYFENVVVFKDSLKSTAGDPNLKADPDSAIHKANADLAIILDHCRFYESFFNTYQNFFYTRAILSWIVHFKNDTTSYMYNQTDTLTFNDSEALDHKFEKLNLRKTILDAAHYLGNSFGAKIIPDWIEVERIYYTSSNPEMARAEKYAKNGDWLKAAEIWKKETKNKNDKIVAKALYNMALACEMEGKPDVGIDWLVKSYSTLKGNDKEHKENCQRYINILATRKKEIKILERQVRPNPVPENSQVLP